MSDDPEIKDKELNAIDVDTSLDGAVDPAPNTEKPKIPDPNWPKKKKIIIVVSIIVGLLLIGGLAYWWFVAKPQPTSDSSANTTPQTEDAADTTDYAKELIDKIRTAEQGLATTYPQIVVSDTDPHSPAYKPSGEQYYIAGEIGHALTTSDPSQETNTTAFNSATEAAAEKVLDADTTLTKTPSDMIVRYESVDVVCSISHDSYPFYATCANVRDYTPLATEIAPFADAFAKDPDNAQYLSTSVFGTPNIKKGQDGYQNATLTIGSYEGMGGYAGLYYGNGAWTFWRGTQSYIPCEDYNSIELQKSFVGEPCYEDGDDNAKVEVTL